LDEDVWDPTTFTKNRDRLLEADVAKEFLAQVVAQARARGLTSDEYFTVDGTLLELTTRCDMSAVLNVVRRPESLCGGIIALVEECSKAC
jgi:hypothetical protein